MAGTHALFKGIKQTLYETYTGLSTAEQVGYLWFVRESSGSTNGDIYLGSRHYGHYNANEQNSIVELIDKVAANTSSIAAIENALKGFKAGTDLAKEEDESGNTVLNVSLSEDIEVAGLNDSYGCGLIKNGNTIKAGTSLSDILKQMLQKELNPGAATKPSITITKVGGTAAGLVEIGSKVDVGSFSITPKSGYFNNNGWKTPVQPAASFEWGTDVMSSKISSGIDGYTGQTDVTSITSAEATILKGTNTITISASKTYTAPTNSPITNLKNTYDGTDATWVDGTATATTSVSWTGVYPCFVNTNSLGEEPTKRLDLSSTYTFEESVPSHNDNDFRFAYPDGWEIKSFQVKSVDGSWQKYMGAYEKQAGSLKKTIQDQTVTYYYLGGVKNGAAEYKITLSENRE